MTKQIKIIFTKLEEKLVEIEFPFYRQSIDFSDDGTSWKTCCKIDSDGITTTLSKTIMPNGHYIKHQGHDFMIGTDANKATTGQFNDILHEIREKVDKLFIK